MEIVKNVSAVLGLVLSGVAVLTLCSKTFKSAVSSIFKKYGNDTHIDGLFNQLRAELREDIDMLTKKLDNHIEEQQAEHFSRSRRHILEFADKLYKGEKPDIEYTANVLDYIDAYEEYCHTHPLYPNSKADAAITTIRKYYDKITTINP